MRISQFIPSLFAVCLLCGVGFAQEIPVTHPVVETPVGGDPGGLQVAPTADVQTAEPSGSTTTHTLEIAKKKPEMMEKAAPKKPVEKDTSTLASGFVPDFEDTDLAGSETRAWEYRPYRVAVWFCLDGSPALESVYPRLSREVTRRSEWLDPSGWDLTTGRAPTEWSAKFQKHLSEAEEISNSDRFKRLDTLLNYDKLMVACLDRNSGVTTLRVREFDVQTQLWGPLLRQTVMSTNQLGSQLMRAINNAFMPLARIERVLEPVPAGEPTAENPNPKKVDSRVLLRIRAANACVRSDDIARVRDGLVDEDGNVTLNPVAGEPIEQSPVYVRSNDRFLPVIRRTDREGNLVKLEPIAFTYLTVAERSEEAAEARCSIQSYHRAPLSQRKSKRSQKLGLVIRPLKASTKLQLVSQDKERTPREGYEIWSRQPDQPKDEPSEYLGKSNWRGEIEIPPNDEGLRIIFVKRGSRALKRLPIIPGLYQEVSATLPNDDTRLFAEGTIRSYESELLSLVIRRKVIREDLMKALESEDKIESERIYETYQALETMRDINVRLSNEEANLRAQTDNKREQDHMQRMFQALRNIVNKQQSGSKDTEILQKLEMLK